VSGSPARIEEQGEPRAPRSAATHAAPRAARTAGVPGGAGAAGSPVPAAAVRGAALADVPQLEALMAPYVATGDLLPRSNYDLCRHIKEYVVAEAAGGEIVGCGSLKIYSRALGEVAGLAVRSDWQSAGVGRALLGVLVAEARAQGLSEVLALTRKPAFFLRLGFMPAEREQFPLKVWADCARCPRQNCCDEIAVVRTL
jgi:amino-acid N-acetyltransferase